MADGDMELLEQMRRQRSGWEQWILIDSIVALVSGGSPGPGRHTGSTSIPNSPTYVRPLGGIFPSQRICHDGCPSY